MHATIVKDILTRTYIGEVSDVCINGVALMHTWRSMVNRVLIRLAL